MKPHDVIRMAKEAGLDIGVWEKLYDDDDVFGYEVGGINENLEAFAKLVAEHEREACAKLFDDRDNGIGFYEPHEPAEIIRARGKA